MVTVVEHRPANKSASSNPNLRPPPVSIHAAPSSNPNTRAQTTKRRERLDLAKLCAAHYNDKHELLRLLRDAFYDVEVRAKKGVATSQMHAPSPFFS